MAGCANFHTRFEEADPEEESNSYPANNSLRHPPHVPLGSPHSKDEVAEMMGSWNSFGWVMMSRPRARGADGE